MLGQIGLEALEAGGVQRVRQTDLLAKHRLHARDPLRLRLAAQVDDDARGLVGRRRPVHLRTGSDGVAFELEQVVIEVLDDVVLDPLAPFAGGLELRKIHQRGGTLALRRAGRAVDRQLQRGISERRVRARLERDDGGLHGGAHPLSLLLADMEGASAMPASTSAAW